MTRSLVPVLTKLRRTEISTICEQIGLKTTGTKSILVNSIQDAVENAPLPPRARVLSIDLGLRNLAYSLLETPDVPSKHEQLKKDTVARRPLKLLEWNVVALVPSDVAPLPALDTDGEKPSTSAASAPDAKFSPSALAIVAVHAVRNLIMPLKPTHILLERQRWRSGGGPVLEWTLRINSLEAMLHAVLASMRAEGLWKGDVHSVEPGRVVATIEPPAEMKQELKEGSSRSKAKRVKRSKVEVEVIAEDNLEDLVVVKSSKTGRKQTAKRVKMDEIARVLESAHGESTPGVLQALTLGSDAMREKSLYYLQKVKGRRPAGSEKRLVAPADWSRLAKVDDLADSLLQGLVWCKWQRNRQDLVDGELFTEAPVSEKAGKKTTSSKGRALTKKVEEKATAKGRASTKKVKA